jgi:glycosyltransferase involved in cell wall biosynthesis
MKVFSPTSSSPSKNLPSFPPDVKVTMHVVSPVRNDGRILREATALRAEGLTVSVVDIEAQATCPAEEDIQGLRVKHVFMSRDFAETRFAKQAALRALLILIRSVLYLIKLPTDIYHAHDTIGLPACAIAALVRRKPLVFDAHELPLAELRVSRAWLRNLMVRLLTSVVRRCAGVITVSAPIAEEIRRCYQARQVTLVRNTPLYQAVEKNDRLRQYLGLGPEVRIALYQGNIQEDRRLDTLVHAAKSLERDVVLVLMGKDMRKTVSKLQAQAIGEGVAERVKFVPPVPYEELLEWAASADIGLIIYAPDHSLNVKMCLPNKLFEYMMAGLPVLATQLDAVADVLNTHDAGRTISSIDATEVGSAINAMIADRHALARMSRNALDAVQQEFNWGEERQKLLLLYYAIIKSQKTFR